MLSDRAKCLAMSRSDKIVFAICCVGLTLSVVMGLAIPLCLFLVGVI